MSYTRQYPTRINWQNTPSVSTPINATNLNYMDSALYYMDAEIAYLAGMAYACAGIGGMTDYTDTVITTDVNLHRDPDPGDRILVYFNTKATDPTQLITIDDEGHEYSKQIEIMMIPDYYLNGICVLELRYDDVLDRDYWTLIWMYEGVQYEAGNGITISNNKIINSKPQNGDDIEGFDVTSVSSGNIGILNGLAKYHIINFKVAAASANNKYVCTLTSSTGGTMIMKHAILKNTDGTNYNPAIVAGTTIICRDDGGTGSEESPVVLTVIDTGYVVAGRKASTTLGIRATAEGENTTASGNRSHAEGYSTQATGIGAHAEGESTKATNSNTHAEGVASEASGQASHAEGTSTKASGHYSHAEGQGAKAQGNSSHAEGYYTTATGDYSHAGGYYTTAGYANQTVIGKYNNNKSTTIFEVGNGTSNNDKSNAFEVYSNGSVCEGVGNTVSQPSAHAEGSETAASNYQAHAEGYGTTASGQASHAEGNNTTASALGAHAEGGNTLASGQYSHASGYETVADHDYQAAYGKYNKALADTLFEVGNGTGASARSNALEVLLNGDVVAGNEIIDGQGNTLSVLAEALTKTASGNPIVITDCAGGKARSLKTAIEAIQDLHGYDKPWSGGAGKNKFDITEISDVGNAIKTKEFTLNANATYTISTDLPKNNNNSANLFFYLPSASPDTSVNGVWSGQTRTLTTGADGKFIIGYRTTDYTDPSAEWYLSHKIQIEEGSTATAYAPYSNICPISGRDSVRVDDEGVNICPDNWELGTVRIVDGKVVFGDATDRRRIKNLRLSAGTYSYKVNDASTSLTAVALYDDDMNNIPFSFGTSVFVVPKDAYFACAINSLAPVEPKMQINRGGDLQPYSPYAHSSATIQLGTTVYGAEVDFDTGVVTVSKSIATESAFASISSGVSDGGLHYLDYTPSNVVRSSLLCSHVPYIYDGNEAWASTTPCVTINNSGRIRIFVTSATLAAFQSDYSGLSIIYELATTTTLQLTPAQLELLKGYDRVSIDNGSIELGYIGKIA